MKGYTLRFFVFKYFLTSQIKKHLIQKGMRCLCIDLSNRDFILIFDQDKTYHADHEEYQAKK